MRNLFIQHATSNIFLRSYGFYYYYYYYYMSLLSPHGLAFKWSLLSQYKHPTFGIVCLRSTTPSSGPPLPSLSIVASMSLSIAKLLSSHGTCTPPSVGMFGRPPTGLAPSVSPNISVPTSSFAHCRMMTRAVG